MTDSADQKRHRELVRLSYLILPGGGSQESRLALARRIVERSLPRRPAGTRAYAEARTRVLRQSLRPPRRLRLRAAPWLRLRAGSPPGNAALAALAPEERLAYVLCRVAGLRRHVVRELLADLGVPGSRDLLGKVDSMRDLHVVAPAAPLRIRPRGGSRLPVTAACLATCALITAAVLQDRDIPAAAVRDHNTPATSAERDASGANVGERGVPAGAVEGSDTSAEAARDAPATSGERGVPGSDDSAEAARDASATSGERGVPAGAVEGSDAARGSVGSGERGVPTAGAGALGARGVRYWRGELPGGAGFGELVCRRVARTDGGVGRQGALLWRGERYPARDCADGRTGLWWRSPAGRWLYLAAAEPPSELTVPGGRLRKGGLWTVRGPLGGSAPEREILPPGH